MKVWDVETISTALELARPWRVHVPVVLAALCGLRRGEIAALRWRHVDLDRAQLSVTESGEQTKAGVRYKSPKNGKGRRTVALPAVVMAELRAHRLRQAQELLQLGVRLSDETSSARERMAERSNPIRSAMRGIGFWHRQTCRGSAFTICDIRTRARSSRATYIRRSSASGSATAASG